MLSDILTHIDGFAGLAALVNGLLLWPTIKAVQRSVKALEDRVNQGSKMGKPGKSSTRKGKPSRGRSRNRR